MSKKRTAVFILCVAVAVSAVGYLVYHWIDQNRMQAVYETAQEVAKQEDTESGSGTEDTDYDSPIDFEALWDINPDIYAWIEITDTEIAYPIVQHATDDDYYLNHTIEGEEGYPGSIYTQTINKRDFSRFNTVIYGHNVPEGMMFSDLKDYQDEEFLEEHREIIIYTPDAKRTYRVFAAVVYDDRLITSAFDDDNEDDRQAFLDSIYSNDEENSHVLYDVDVTTDSHIITLSTCVHNQSDKRYLVTAVLIDEEG